MLLYFSNYFFNNKVKYFKKLKIKKWYKRTYLKKQADSHIENTFMLNKGNSRGRSGEINSEFGINMHTLLYTKQ